MGYHTVRQGDCIESMAFQHGHFWETVWNDPRNRDLRSLRKEHSVLMPGDKVFVPDLRPKQESCETERCHRFVRKGVPSKLQLRFLLNGQPRRGVQYVLRVDGRVLQGVTDDQGYLEEAISPNAREASVVLVEEGAAEEYTIDLGCLDPGSELSGMQGRLTNLGFMCGRTGKLDEATQTALRAFQRAYELTVTGQLDTGTRDRILEIHDAKLGEPRSESGATTSET